jgi:hypothetical protein
LFFFLNLPGLVKKRILSRDDGFPQQARRSSGAGLVQTYGGCSSVWLERWIVVPEVAGSSPVFHPKKAGLSQMVEAALLLFCTLLNPQLFIRHSFSDGGINSQLF